MPIKTLGNVVVTYNANNITTYLNTASLEVVAEVVDTTNYASTAKESLPTMTSYTLPIGGMWMAALDAIIGADARTPPSTFRTLAVQIGPSGNRVTYTWTGSTTTVGAFVDSYTIDFGDPMGITSWSANLNISGAPVLS